MAKTKYKEYVDKMLAHNRELFDSFRKVHDRYILDPDNLQEELNEIGKKVMSVVNEYEDKLCSQSEKGGYGQYAGKLAEKFRTELRKDFSHINHVGIRVFKIEKINLQK